jgi:PAS domain S-box-containing protein
MLLHDETNGQRKVNRSQKRIGKHDNRMNLKLDLSASRQIQLANAKQSMDAMVKRYRTASAGVSNKADRQWCKACARKDPTSAPMVTINPAGIIIEVNEKWVRTTGLAQEQLVGTHFLDYFTDAPAATDGNQRVFSWGNVRDFPLAIRHTSDSSFDVRYNASAYKDRRGNILGAHLARA